MLTKQCVDSEARTESLRDRVLAALNSPGTEKFRRPQNPDVGSKCTLQTRVGNCLVVLMDRRSEQQVARGVSGQQRGLAPGPAHAKIDSARRNHVSADSAP